MDYWDNNRQGPFEDMGQGFQFGFPGGFGQSGPPFFGFPGFGGFSPPFGLPGGQFNPPFGGGQTGQGGQSGPPSGPPPSFVPQQPQVGVLAVDPGAIRRCRFRFVYIWTTFGQQFWAWLVFVGPRSIAGWRWNGFRWVYFGLDLNLIASFTCF